MLRTVTKPNRETHSKAAVPKQGAAAFFLFDRIPDLLAKNDGVYLKASDAKRRSFYIVLSNYHFFCCQLAKQHPTVSVIVNRAKETKR